jgi:putative phosphoesterase
MRVLVLSDIHGNLPALEYVLKQERSVDLIISLGDVVNYGPWSNECVDLMDTLTNKVLILGNHEDAFIAGKYPGSNLVAKTFFDVCYPTFNRKDKIMGYQKSYSYNDCDFVHTLNNSYIFSDTEVQISKDTFVGHSHRLFSKETNGYRLVNVGSVGQNRVNIDEINYAILNAENNSVELVKKTFSSDKLIDEMKAKNYPDICLDYILSKRSKL